MLTTTEKPSYTYELNDAPAEPTVPAPIAHAPAQKSHVPSPAPFSMSAPKVNIANLVASARDLNLLLNKATATKAPLSEPRHKGPKLAPAPPKVQTQNPKASKVPSPKAPSPKAPSPKVPSPKVPSPKAPSPKAPSPKSPTLKAPSPKSPTLKAPSPKAPTPKAPSPISLEISSRAIESAKSILGEQFIKPQVDSVKEKTRAAAQARKIQSEQFNKAQELEERNRKAKQDALELEQLRKENAAAAKASRRKTELEKQKVAANEKQKQQKPKTPKAEELTPEEKEQNERNARAAAQKSAQPSSLYTRVSRLFGF